MLHNFLNPLKQATAGLRVPPALPSPPPPYLLLSGPRLGTGNNQPRFIAWLHLGLTKPSTRSSHLILLYTTGRVVLGKTMLGGELGLYFLENPRAYGPSVQLQTTSEYYHPAPAQLILHRGGGWWTVVTASPCS